MKIGLFFGSFNPVHVGHMVIAQYMTEETLLDQVWFVVSPHNPLKNKKTLLNQEHRLMMVRIATEDYSNLKACNIEFNLPKPSYTTNTLAYLQEKYVSHDFALIMGYDNLQSLHKWKNFKNILNNHELYIYPRPDSTPCELDSHHKINLTDAPMIDLSASLIREGVRKRKDMSCFLPSKVWKYLDEMNFYK